MAQLLLTHQEDPVTTTTARPTSTTRPPYNSRVFWQTSTYPVEVATGTVLSPATPDVPTGPAGTTPVLSRGTICHVNTARLRELPRQTA